MKKIIEKLSRKSAEKAYTHASTLYLRREYSAAAKEFRGLASTGHALSQLKLAQMFEHGEGVGQDLVEATHWYKAAAKQKIADAEARLGELLLVGVFPTAQAAAAAANAGAGTAAYANALQKMVADSASVRQNPAEALRWNQLAAKAGNTGAEARLGYQFAVGLGTPVDLKLAETHFAAAAAKGNAAGQLGLGMLYSKCYGGDADYEKAAHWLALAADQGNATAKYCLAALSLFNHIPALETDRLLQLLTEAAEAKHPAAMFHLGELYRLGHGVPVSLPDAETWLRRAAVQGNVAANLSLVRLLLALDPPDYDSAAALCRQAAEAGDGQAQLLLGQMYQAGTGVPKDGTEAARWLNKAADQGVIVAYEKLGALYSEGAVLEQDFRAAADWYHRAAAEGSADALYHLGTLQFEGLGVTRDPKAALEGYRQAADKGSTTAALSIGVMYASGNGVEQDYRKAAEAYQRAADLGLTEARFNLAFLYLRGLGVQKDSEKGVALLEQAVEEKSLDAVWALHTLYSEGEYIAHDPAKSAAWLMRAAEMGSVQAASRLCAWLDEANPHAPPAEAVVGLMQKCAEQGESTAQLTLSKLYKDGRHVAADAQLARKWLLKAADAGNAAAQAELGDALLAGDGQPADPVAAARWYERASRNGHTGATLALTRLGLELNPDGLDYAKLFTRWLAAAKRGDVLAQRMVGEYYLKGIGTQASVTDAMQWLEKASKAGNDAAMVMLGGVYARGDQFPPDPTLAFNYFVNAAERGNADGAYNLGVCYRAGLGVEANLGEAIEWYRVAAEGGQLAARTALADALVRSGDDASLKEAVDWFKKAIEVGDGHAAIGLAKLYESGSGVEADPAESARLVKLAAELGVDVSEFVNAQAPAADPASAKVDDASRRLEALMVEGQALIDAKQLAGALQLFETACSANPGFAFAHLQRARVLMQMGRFVEAKQAAAVTTALDPSDVGGNTVLGLMQFRLGELDAAEVSLRSAIALGTGNPWAYISTAQLLERRDANTEAAEVLRKGLELRHDEPLLRGHLARVLLSSGKLAEAEEILRGAIEDAPHVPELSLFDARLQQRKREPQRADAAFRKAISMQPNRKEWSREYGMFLFSIGDCEECERVLTQTLDVDPSHAASFFVLAKARQKLGKLSLALSAIHTAMQIAPDRKDFDLLKRELEIALAVQG